MTKINKEQYEHFLGCYALELLKDDRARYGEVFLRCFPEASKDMRLRDNIWAALELELFHTPKKGRAQVIINRWLAAK